MVDNRYATALVIGSVLSLLACVYLSVAIGTQHWYQYHSQPASNDANNGSDLQRMRQNFEDEDTDEHNYSIALFRLNGTLGLWWRCILVPQNNKEPGKPVEVSVLVPAGVCGAGVSSRIDRNVCLSVPKSQAHPICRAAASACWPVLFGNGMLFSCGCAPATRKIRIARGYGLFSGMVFVFGPGLFSAANNGRCTLHMGCQEPSPKLHSNDSL
ncbi:Claudin domain-containing protein 1 [Triplophysa tibetana]|uniref:Claudin domain-containing protein 1 n=1 Tax=Triplophysa tibetana TaxID=1572043 RepID=A0A5A9PMR0_9TELE|nr:Claudin domain-containing protein 1 [Triplophysa tibetana]